VKNLAGNIPPNDYEMKSYAAVMAAQRNGPDDADDEDSQQ
jgi:dipeptidyl-peptidase 4